MFLMTVIGCWVVFMFVMGLLWDIISWYAINGKKEGDE